VGVVLSESMESSSRESSSLEPSPFQRESLLGSETLPAGGRCDKLVRLILQLFHLSLATGMLLMGIVEFSVESSVFDLFGSRDRSAVPKDVFPVSGTCFVARLTHSFPCNALTASFLKTKWVHVGMCDARNVRLK